MLTPADVHAGRGETVRQQRQAVLQRAFQAHPERFVTGPPRPAKLPEAVWINPPKASTSQAAPTLDLADGPPGAVSAKPGTLHFAGAELAALASVDTPTIAQPTDLPYTAISGTEDRATLRSDLSAVPADGVAGQSRCRKSMALPTTSLKKELHCQ